jgi:hypothetical protein
MTACDPRGSEVEVNVADLPASGEVPSPALPAEKVMLPVGTPVPDIGVTFAVKTVAAPKTGAAGVTESAVEVDISVCCEDCEELFPPQAIVSKSVASVTAQKAKRE